MSVEVQWASEATGFPGTEDIIAWATTALGEEQGELCIRVVDSLEARELNSRYRGKNKPTNVLSFPADVHHDDCRLLGDVVICAAVVVDEAADQGKAIIDHCAHMVVHGVLHLLGYDHQQHEQAEQMEALEIEFLAELGIANPYLTA